ncbi:MULTISPECIES: hypothetical protein [unclassified Burkholderia]|uniref:hypothetical protein n=1 Tax=unclassified Burkholderia TaxID=2613784 RepID=UPI00197F2D73|nr:MULTISPECIES: hypothetical protein [unclassified Burkholderia]MBN3769272.1 hypothetical protein [Burkholderia sp. Se-20378]MBN3793984.1 hypothetical protein [Burkholderia sp. Ac-20392]
MTSQFHAESLHRTVKRLVDSGRAKSFDEAQAIADGFRLHLDLSASFCLHEQIAAIALVELGRRAFLGGVSVSGVLDVALHHTLGDEKLLRDALKRAGAREVEPAEGVPIIKVGAAGDPRSPFHIRLLMAGWRAGVTPVDERLEMVTATDGYVMPLAAVAAAALAVSEAFRYVSDGSGTGLETTGLSLWAPGELKWVVAHADGPRLQVLPSSAWLLGLGHLGQAFAWCLSLLPYPREQDMRPHLILQDTDVVGASTESTSVLTNARDKNSKKTRVVAAWMERKGFSTNIVERGFDSDTRRGLGEPSLVFCGVDNPEARRALDAAGFSFIVEAGLGGRYDDFQCLRVHTFPASRTTPETWVPHPISEPVLSEAYVHLVKQGQVSQCGIVQLAEKAVGAAFVGAFTAALAVSEALRVLHGQSPSEVADIDMFALGCRNVVQNRRDFSSINPGFVAVE